MMPLPLTDSGKQPPRDRGVSPQVGIIFIIAFTLLVAMSLFLFGQGILNDTTDPRTDAQFGIEAVNKTHLNVTYNNGDPFTTSNTERLYVNIFDSDGNKVGELTIFDDSGLVDIGDGSGKLTQNSVIIRYDRSYDNNIRPGMALQFIWVPDGQLNTHKNIDEIVIPSEQYIIIETSEGGSWQFGGNITFG